MTCGRFSIQVPAPQAVRVGVPATVSPPQVIAVSDQPHPIVHTPPDLVTKVFVPPPTQPAVITTTERVGPAGPPGPPGSGDGGGTWREILQPTSDPHVFTTVYSVNGANRVTANGIPNRQGPHYSVAGNTITFAFPPRPWWLMEIEYTPT